MWGVRRLSPRTRGGDIRGLAPWAVVASLLFPPLLSAPTRAAEKVDPAHLETKDCPAQPGCNALVLVDRTVLNNEPLRARIEVFRRTKIFNQAGIDLYGTMQVVEVLGYDSVRNMKGRTILPDGSSLPLQRELISSKIAFKHGKTRIKVHRAPFPGLVPGAIIEFSYENHAARPGYYAGFLWGVQHDIPVLTSEFVLKQGKYVEFDWREAGLQPLTIGRESPFRNATNFFARDVPAIPVEPMGPPEAAWRKRVQFFPKGMDGRWLPAFTGSVYHDVRRLMQQTVACAAKVKEIVADDATPLEKARGIHAFVKRSIDEPMGTTDLEMASSVDEILARGYGTEYERTVLFLAMAEKAGIPGAVLLIAGRESAGLDVNLPDSDQLDAWGAAVLMDGNWRYADLSTQDIPFGFLAPDKESDVVNAVVVRMMPMGQALDMRENEKGKLERFVSIPVTRAARNLATRDAVVRLNAEGGARIEITEQALGHAALETRTAYGRLTPEERREHLEETLTKLMPGAHLVEARFDKVDEGVLATSLSYSVSWPSFATVTNEGMIVPASVFGRARTNPFTATERKTPIHFPRTVKTTERMIFELPAGYGAGEQGEPVHLQDGPLWLDAWFEKNEMGRVVFFRRVEIDRTVWPADQYGPIRAFHEALTGVDRRSFVLRKEPIP